MNINFMGKSNIRQKIEEEKNFHRLTDDDGDETSLTFYILNQEESQFEKQLFQSRRVD